MSDLEKLIGRFRLERPGGFLRWDHPEGLQVTFRLGDEDGRVVIQGMRDFAWMGGASPSDMVRWIPFGRIEAAINSADWKRQILEAMAISRKSSGPEFVELEPPTATLDDLRLSVPPARPYPVSFYENVATAYQLARPVGDPSALIAEANGVPVGTVRRWVHVARNKHGLLPETSTGKAG